MNIAEILRKCPQGTQLYSPLLGNVKLINVIESFGRILIRVEGFSDKGFTIYKFNAYGFFNCLDIHSNECMLFPSRYQRDWSKFVVDKPDSEKKYQFKPFEMVLVRDEDDRNWTCNFFSYINDYGEYICIDSYWKQCIPYKGNEHLLGTTNKPKEL